MTFKMPPIIEVLQSYDAEEDKMRRNLLYLYTNNKTAYRVYLRAFDKSMRQMNMRRHYLRSFLTDEQRKHYDQQRQQREREQ